MTLVATLLGVLAVASAIDPVGDVPPSLEATPPAVDAAPATTVVLLPTVGLGVDDAVRVRASTLLRERLSARARVIDGATLPGQQQEALSSCEVERCAVLLRPLSADAVVTSSIGPIAGELVLTVRVRDASAVQRLQVRGVADALPDLAERAAAAMPLDGAQKPPVATKTPTERPVAPAAPADTRPPATVTTDAAAMVLLYYALGFVPVIGSPLLLPFVQGFAAEQLGPNLVGLEYKTWSSAVLAGYATYLVGFTLGGGAYVTGVTLAASGNQVGLPLIAGGVVTMLATVIAEPIVFHLVSVGEATPVESSR